MWRRVICSHLRYARKPRRFSSSSASSLRSDDIDEKPRPNLFGSESEADFSQRIFSNSGDNSRSTSFFRQMDRGRNSSNEGSRSGMFDDLDESFTTLSDGVDTKLMKAARYFEYDSEEVEMDEYTYRPDVIFKPTYKYEPKDLDLTKPGVDRPFKRPADFETTTAEVLRKADFRNVRYLANFITEAGILIKRSQTGISAKAQRKVAREVKTARALGLMPFTTMGSKQFVFGRTMENLTEDYEFEAQQYDTTSFVADTPDPI